MVTTIVILSIFSYLLIAGVVAGIFQWVMGLDFPNQEPDSLDALVSSFFGILWPISLPTLIVGGMSILTYNRLPKLGKRS